jgi:hypothetical protein
MNYGEVSVAGCVPNGQDNQLSVANVAIAKPAVGYYSLT